MKAVKLQLANRSLLNPAAPQWSKVPSQELALAGTPVHLLPSPYLRATWSGRNIGAVRALSVKAAHNSRFLFIRLDWPDESEDRDYAGGRAFPDAAAVLFATEGQAPLETMGAPGKPVSLWYWRANQPAQAETLAAEGLATEAPAPGPELEAQGRWDDGRWSVVLCRALDPAVAPSVNLNPGASQPVGFAVWEGSHQERGPIYSHSRAWQELTVE